MTILNKLIDLNKLFTLGLSVQRNKNTVEIRPTPISYKFFSWSFLITLLALVFLIFINDVHMGIRFSNGEVLEILILGFALFLSISMMLNWGNTYVVFRQKQIDYYRKRRFVKSIDLNQIDRVALVIEQSYYMYKFQRLVDLEFYKIAFYNEEVLVESLTFDSITGWDRDNIKYLIEFVEKRIS